MAESILGHNWRNEFFPDMGFCKNKKEQFWTIFRVKKTHKGFKFLAKAKKTTSFGGNFVLFLKMRKFTKFRLFQFFALKTL